MLDDALLLPPPLAVPPPAVPPLAARVDTTAALASAVMKAVGESAAELESTAAKTPSVVLYTQWEFKHTAACG